MEIIKPFENESLDEYIYRLGINKDKFNLTWKDICDNVHVYFDKKISKDYIRHAVYGMKQRNTIDNVGVGCRILCVSDQHYPFNLPTNILSDYADKVDILIFNGDEQDCQSISKFKKKYRVPFVDEMIGARAMMIETIDLIKPKKVIINYGNHNMRLISYFSEKIHEDVLQLMPETNLDFIVDMGFWKNNHMEKTKTFYNPLKNIFQDTDIEIEYTKNWWVKIGKTIFAHPKAYKNGILATTEKAYLHFMQIGERDIDALVVAHTHASGISRYGNTFLIESGCLCGEMEYTCGGSLMRPQSSGFVYVVLNEDGNFIYDKSKLIFL